MNCHVVKCSLSKSGGLAVLCCSIAGAQATLPVLRISPGHSIEEIQKFSQIGDIKQGFSGSINADMWEVVTPAFLAFDERGCSFQLPIPRLLLGSIILVVPKTTRVVDEVSVNSFGNMTAEAATEAANRLTMRLKNAGWKQLPNDIGLSALQIQRALRTDDSAAVADLQCGQSEVSIALSRDPRHRQHVSYSFVMFLNGIKH